MVEKVKITGTAIGMDTGDPSSDIELTFELPLRDLFAAFALAGILAKGHSDEDLDAEVAGADAYYFADAAINAREGME